MDDKLKNLIEQNGDILPAGKLSATVICITGYWSR